MASPTKPSLPHPTLRFSDAVVTVEDRTALEAFLKSDSGARILRAVALAAPSAKSGEDAAFACGRQAGWTGACDYLAALAVYDAEEGKGGDIDPATPPLLDEPETDLERAARKARE